MLAKLRAAIGWEKLPASVTDAECLARSDEIDLPTPSPGLQSQLPHDVVPIAATLNQASEMTPGAEEFGELISELQEWNGGAGISAKNWIGCVGNYDLAIGYSLIFWPRFDVTDDYVFCEGATKNSFDRWWLATSGNALAVQSVMNHFHLTDVHSGDSNESRVRYLGQILKQTYEAKLKLEFPN